MGLNFTLACHLNHLCQTSLLTENARLVVVHILTFPAMSGNDRSIGITIAPEFPTWNCVLNDGAAGLWRPPTLQVSGNAQAMVVLAT